MIQNPYPQIKINNLEMLNVLTKKQRVIASLLGVGKSRKEIANDLKISLQAVHQIVLRMRERFGERPLNYYQKREQLIEFYRCLVFAGLLMEPERWPEDMYEKWLTDIFLREYSRPPLILIKKIYKDFGI